jgi:serine protease Do
MEATNMVVVGFGEIAERLRRSTVLIRAGRGGNGSGTVWSSDGLVVTNAHVARASRLRIELWDGRELEGTVESRDLHLDLAAIRIDAAQLPAVTAGDSSKIRAGELAIAVGNPLGFVGALATGVIHGVGALRGVGSQTWVQADVRLAPGNSGGPLADARGHVIGINTMVAGRLALAIPSNAIARFVSGAPSDGWLGVTVQPVRIPVAGARAAIFGLVLLEVQEDSPAGRASLLVGDILLGTGSQGFTELGDLSAVLQGTGSRQVRLEFLRGDYAKIRRVTVALGAGRAARSFRAA